MRKYLAIGLVSLASVAGISTITACGNPAPTVVYEVDDDDERYEYDD